MTENVFTSTPIRIDCTGAHLGRIATKICTILMGKNTPHYAPQKDSRTSVVAMNAEKLAFTRRQMDSKTYIRHSGYPGGLHEESLGDLFQRNPREVLRRAVLGMLPKNRLRAKRIKRLRFE